MVAGAGDALNTQDNVRRDDAEHNDLSHVHNLTRSRLGRLHIGHAQTQIALYGGLLVRVYPRPAEPTASDRVPLCQQRSTVSAEADDGPDDGDV